MFCCLDCQQAYHVARVEQEKKKLEAKSLIENKYPECVIKTLIGGFRDSSVYISFTFPGGQYSVDWYSNEPGIILVSKCDIPAWRKFVSPTNCTLN